MNCIYCGRPECPDPQNCQEKAFNRDNPKEKRSLADKLREMQSGVCVVLNSDEMRQLKTLDKRNEIRCMPTPAVPYVDGAKPDWMAWFEYQTIHSDDMAQVTCRIPDQKPLCQ